MGKYSLSCDQNLYRDFCDKNENNDIQIFAQPWYLDAVCGDKNAWSVITVSLSGFGIIGAFPYLYEKHFVSSIHNPQLTPRLGIWIDRSHCSDNFSRFSLEDDVTELIMQNIPNVDKFQIAFDARYKNWQKLYELGYKQTVFYSYVKTLDDMKIQPISDTFHGNQRRAVNKALEKGIEIIELDIDSFWSFQEESFARRGRKNSISKDLYYRVAKAVVEHKSGRITGAINEAGNVVCTLFNFIDSRRVYEMLTSYNPDLKPDSRPLLTFDAMRFAYENGKEYDFEGSMIPGVSSYNAAFNGLKEPYMIISKYSKRYSAMDCIRNIIKTST